MNQLKQLDWIGLLFMEYEWNIPLGNLTWLGIPGTFHGT